MDLTEECRAAVERWDGGYGAPARDHRVRRSLTVFRTPWVERWLATSHPALPGVWFGGFIAWGLLVGFLDPEVGPVAGSGLFALGVVAWTLLEHLLHRHVFHLSPGAGFPVKLRQFLAHGYPHRFPDDPWRPVAPPLMSWPLALAVWGLERLLLGPDLAWAMSGGPAPATSPATGSTTRPTTSRPGPGRGASCGATT